MTKTRATTKTKTKTVTRAFGFALIAANLAAGAAQAIIIRHDVDDDQYVVDDADYPAVVDLISPGDCLGTLIHPSYLLTVAHCAVDLSAGASLNVAGTPHTVAEVIVHPSWNDEDAFDIALVRFSVPVSGVAPVPVYRGGSELDATITLVGRGTTATGLVGEEGGDTDGLLRRAHNVVTDVDQHFFEIVFDTGGDALPLEGVGAAGDSGGPSFISVGGVPHIAGLNSFGDADGNTGIGEYGSFDYQTRVSQYVPWIESHVDLSSVPADDPADGPVVNDPPSDDPVDDTPVDDYPVDPGTGDDEPVDDTPSPDTGSGDDAPSTGDGEDTTDPTDDREGRVDDDGNGGDVPGPGSGDGSPSNDDDGSGGEPLPEGGVVPLDGPPQSESRPGVTITFGCDAAPSGTDTGLGATLALLGLALRRRRGARAARAG